MIYRGHMIDKMADVYKKTFPVRSKKEFIALLQPGELLLVFNLIVLITRTEPDQRSIFQECY